VDRPRREAFNELVAGARAGDGTIDAEACLYPVHELPEHGTELRAVGACDDGIWPLF
jgi:hypothetical protein